MKKGTWLREMRESVGLYSKKVASILGVKPSTYCLYECGVNPLPTRHYGKIARLYGMTMEQVEMMEQNHDIR